MILKNSVRHVSRTPIKTTLFVLLLAAVTAFLCFGFNMWLSAAQSIEAAEQAFKTIGIVEWRPPTGVPVYSPDYSPIIASEYVELFDHRALLAGFSESITIDQEFNNYKSGYSLSIIEFTPLGISEDGSWIEARILDVLRSPGFYLWEDAIVSLQIGMSAQGFLNAKGGHSLEVGKSYLTTVSRSNVNLFEIRDPLSGSGPRRWWSDLLNPDSPTEIFLETTEGNYLESDDGQVWVHILQHYDNSLKTMTIYATNGLETILSFHQHKVIISNGRTFSQEDYQEGNQVCIVNSDLARQLNISIGDFIPISFSEVTHTSIGRDTGGYSMDSVNHRGIFDQGDYQVIGFYHIVGDLSQANLYGLMRDTVFIPQRSIDFVPYATMDNLVSFRLTNGTVEAFQQEMEQYELQYLNFTYYDQGYSKVRGIYANMRETALILTLISAGAGLGLVLLFSLLFVGRQRRSIAVMYSLGAGRKKALAFLMLTVAIVSVLATVAGGLAGFALSGPVLTNTYERNAQAMAMDTDYSGIYGEDTEADFSTVIPPRHHAPLAAAGGILAITLACSGLFAAAILRLEPMRVLTVKEE